MNLDHLYFDIVSDLELRISDFAILGVSTSVEMPCPAPISLELSSIGAGSALRSEILDACDW